jgi:hypothetical protein
LARFNAPRPRPVSDPGGLRARLLHRHGFPARFNGVGCIATMRKAAVGAQGRAWSRLDLKTSLLSAHAERMIIRPENSGRRHAAQRSFVEAFDVKPGDAMYLPAEERIALRQTDRHVVCPGKAP